MRRLALKNIHRIAALWLIVCHIFAVTPQPANAVSSGYPQVNSNGQTAIFTVSGIIYDQTAGWPLYAHVTVDGNRENDWAEPDSGLYSLSLTSVAN